MFIAVDDYDVIFVNVCK